MTFLRQLDFHSAKTWQALTSAIVIVIAGTVLVGWLFNVEALKSVLPGFTTMKVNTALCFLLVGIALWLLHDQPISQTRLRMAQICSLIVLLIGLLTLAEYLFGWNLGIDQLLFTDHATSATAFPGRMAFATALNFILLGLAQWLISREQDPTLAQFFALLALCFGLFAFAGYLYGVQELYSFSLFSSVALNTTFVLPLSSISILLLRPHRGFMTVTSTEYYGGFVARRLLPAVIVVPLLIGWIRLKGQEAGLYGTEFGLALYSLSTIILFTLLVWWNARLLNRTDAERERGVEQIEKLHRTLTLLSDINQAIVRTRHIPTLFEKVCEIAVQTGKFRLIWIGLIDPVTQKVTLVAHAGRSNDYLENLKRLLNDDARMQNLVPTLREIADHLVFNDIQTDPLLNPEQRRDGAQLNYRSLALLPLRVAGQLCGIIVLGASEHDFFDSEELRLLDEMAGDITFAMEFSEQEAKRQQAETHLHRYAKRLEILHEIDTGIIQEQSIQALVETTLKHLRQVIPCDRATAIVFNEAANEGLIFANSVDDKTVFGQGVRISLASDFFESEYATSKLLVDDLLSIQETLPRAKQLVREGMKSSLNLPLMDQEHPIGSLGLLSSTLAFFTPEYQEIATEIASQLAIAIRHLQLSEEIIEYTGELEQNVTLIGEMRQFLQTTFDVLSAGIAVLDPDGTIINVNETWERFNAENGGLSATAYLNSNYLTICDTATGPLSAEAAPAAAGIRAVINGAQDDFYLEYPCDAPTHRRWFGMRVTPFSETAPHRVVVAHTDITSRKLAEEALREANETLEQRVHERTLELNHAKERVEAILNYSTDAIVMTDANLRIRQTNPAFESLFAIPDGNPVDQYLLDFVHVEDAGQMVEVIQRVIGERKGDHVELRGVRKDDHIFDTEFSIGYFTEENGGEGIVCIVQDVSERKRSEAILRESEAKFRGLIEAAPIATVVTDQTGTIMLVNQQSENLFGYTSAEMVGQSVEMLIPQDIRERHVQLRADYTQAPRMRPMGIGLELFAHRKEGSDLPIEIDLSYVETESGLLVIAFIVDITERKERERQLHFNASLQEAVSDAVIATDLDFHIQSWNPAAARIYGWETGEVVGKNITEVMKTEFVSGESREQLVQDFMEKGFWSAEVVHHHKDGHAIHMLSSSVLFKDKAGHPAGIVTVNHDISQRQQAERTLRESEARYRLLADNITDMVTRVDAAGLYVYVSPSTGTVLGYEPEELLGKSSFELIHPDDVAELISRQAAALDPTVVMSPSIYRVRHKAGHYVWVETTGQIIRSEDKTGVLGFITVSRDITERKRAAEALALSEQRYSLLVNGVNDYAIYVLDPQGVVVSWNPGAEYIKGYTADEIIGQNFSRFYTAEDVAQGQPQVVLSIAEREGHYVGEGWRVRKDGSRFWAEVVIAPLRNYDGQLIGFTKITRDLTERKIAEERLQKALETERELGELKSRFVSMASHEFRTPLATILASAETLSAYRQRMTDSQIDHRINNIRDQVAHLKNIIEDVLQLARIQAGKLDFNPVVFDLDGLCRSVIDEFQSRPDISHQLIYSYNQVLQEIKLDKKLMRQIINNLVSNAIKYSPEAGKVFISLEATERSVVLSVRDQGIGIPEADLKHLFEPFHRAANVGTISGTGLGLSITKEAVELHGGTIEVASQVGDGTTVIVTIPHSQQTGSRDDENSGH